jgi:ATP-dependent DNA helicase RecQ
VSDEKQRQIATAQLRQIVHFAESSECRRVALLRYFGEDFQTANCGGCDNCLTPRETYDGTLAGQKFLSCVFRVREKSGIYFGINQIVEVLSGAETENVLKWDHQTVSTYGIGKEFSRVEWRNVGRELIRLGYLRQLAEKFNVLQLTEQGEAALRERQPIRLTKSVSVTKTAQPRAGEISCDEGLFERLRRLRKRLADERGVPPYIVFSDVSLRQMARYYPSNESEFAHISGVGEQKLKRFGKVFLSAIAKYRRDNPAQPSANRSRSDQ